MVLVGKERVCPWHGHPAGCVLLMSTCVNMLPNCAVLVYQRCICNNVSLEQAWWVCRYTLPPGQGPSPLSGKPVTFCVSPCARRLHHRHLCGAGQAERARHRRRAQAGHAHLHCEGLPAGHRVLWLRDRPALPHPGPGLLPVRVRPLAGARRAVSWVLCPSRTGCGGACLLCGLQQLPALCRVIGALLLLKWCIALLLYIRYAF